MYKKFKFKEGLHLFNGLRLSFLPSVPYVAFLQRVTFIPYSKVGLLSISPNLIKGSRTEIKL